MKYMDFDIKKKKLFCYNLGRFPTPLKFSQTCEYEVVLFVWSTLGLTQARQAHSPWAMTEAHKTDFPC